MPKRPAWSLKPRLVELATLKHHPRNVRQGDVQLIRESIRSHDQFAPLLVQESTLYIVKGNHTFDALLAEGYEKAWAVILPMSDEQALQIMLMDNRAGEVGGYDEPKLLALLQSFDDLTGTGYTEAMVADMLATLTPPDLDDVLDKLGEPDDRDFWPTVRAKVSPEVYAQWVQHLTRYEDDEDAALGALLAAL